MIFHIISRKSSQNHQKFWPLAFPMCCRRRLVSLNTFPARSAQHGAGSAQARGPGLLRRAAGGESHICWIDEWGLYNVILIEVVWDYKATNITRGVPPCSIGASFARCRRFKAFPPGTCARWRGSWSSLGAKMGHGCISRICWRSGLARGAGGHYVLPISGVLG